MSLSTRLAEVKPKKSGLPCGIDTIMTKMTEDDKQALSNALFDENRTISNTQLHQLLIEEGYDISYSSIALHRRKQCRCFVGRNIRSDKASVHA
jgi:hypothetical protein